MNILKLVRRKKLPFRVISSNLGVRLNIYLLSSLFKLFIEDLFIALADTFYVPQAFEWPR